MRLKYETNTIEDLPEPLRELYEQTEAGSFRLSVDGAVPKTKLDEFRDNNISLAKERDKLAKALADNDPSRVEEIVARRTQELTQRLHRSLIEKTIAQLAAEADVLPTAVDDVVQRAAKVFTVADDGQLRAAGSNGEGDYDDNAQPLQPATWLNNLKTTHPHYFAASSGGGAAGGRQSPRREDRQIRSRADFDGPAEKAAWIAEHGLKAFEALPKARYKRPQDVRTRADLVDARAKSEFIARYGVKKFAELPPR
jgi:hypothetical protein